MRIWEAPKTYGPYGSGSTTLVKAESGPKRTDEALSYMHNKKNQCCESGSEYGSGSVGSICFGPLGSAFGSISQRYGYGYGSGNGSRSFYHQAKIVRKTLIPTVLRLLYNFLSSKNYVNVPRKSK